MLVLRFMGATIPSFHYYVFLGEWKSGMISEKLLRLNILNQNFGSSYVCLTYILQNQILVMQ